MIYLKTGIGQHMIVLSAEDIADVKAGLPIHTSDEMVVIAFTPDQEWLADQVKRLFNDPTGAAAGTVDDLILQSQARPAKPFDANKNAFIVDKRKTN